MVFSRKIIPIALLVLAVWPTVAPADGYSKGGSDSVIDEAKARRLLADIPGIDLKEVWFATGLEDYYKSPACVTARDLYVFTKPMKSTAGLWRGERTYYSGNTKDWTNGDCNDVQLKKGFSYKTASFTDPDEMRPEEAFDGDVPGVFHVSDEVTDDELLGLIATISRIQACLKATADCNIKIKKELGNSPPYKLIPAMNVKNLLSVSILTERDTGKPCYDLIFAEDLPYAGAVTVNIYYRDASIDRVEMDDMLTE